MQALKALSLVLILGGCAGSKKAENTGGETAAAKQIGPATIEGKSGVALSGSVSMKEVDGGVEVHVAVEGAPAGEHAVHVHQTGDCSSDDAKSAGDHFNPEGHQHGLPGAEQTHLGDFGNMTV